MLRTLMSLTLGLAVGIGATAAYGQGTGGAGDSSQQCIVTQLRLRFATSNDDLRGGQDNLNIVVYFTGGGYQIAPNVNQGKNWPNNSVNMVEIPLNRPVPPGEIRALRLVHIADGGFNIHSLPELATPAAPIAIAQAFQSPDNWNMADVEVAFIGNGVGGRIANHGFHRFTGSNPDLIIATQVPPNICGSGRPAGNSGGGSGTLMSPGAEKGMLADRSRSTALVQGNREANAITPNTGSNSGPGGASAKQVTNADILNMLGASLSEETILATMRTRPAKFDVSNQARSKFDKECAKIKHPGLTTAAWAAEVRDIWDAMTNVMICQETNGRGGEGTCVTGGQQMGQSAQPNAGSKGDDSALVPAVQRPALNDGNVATSGGTNKGNRNADVLSPQPYPPKGGKSTPIGAIEQPGPVSKLLKTKLGPAKRGPTIANAAAASHKAAILATLQRQKNAADTVATQMKTALRMAGQPGMSSGPSRTMSASSSNGSAQSTSRTSANAQVGTTSSSNASQNPGIAGARLSQVISPAESQVLMCAQDPTMRIFQVSGTEGPVTFTTDPTGNFYTITGCSFGTAGPNAKAYIYLGNSFHQEFQIQEWNDAYIKCNLDPSLTGVGDQNNLTLVVQRYDGKQAVKTGFKFYAMRETRRLAAFPQQYFSLSKFNVQNVSDLGGGIQSPVDPAGYFPNNTAEVTWGDPDLKSVPNKGFVTAQNTPPTAADIYDFSHLTPGFGVTSASLSWPDPGSYCNARGGKLVATSGTFGGQWSGSQLWITWQGWNCNVWPPSQNCSPLCTDAFGSDAVTDYAVDVIVEGPRGVDPWTGQPIAH